MIEKPHSVPRQGLKEGCEGGGSTKVNENHISTVITSDDK